MKLSFKDLLGIFCNFMLCHIKTVFCLQRAHKHQERTAWKFPLSTLPDCGTFSFTILVASLRFCDSCISPRWTHSSLPLVRLEKAEGKTFPLSAVAVIMNWLLFVHWVTGNVKIAAREPALCVFSYWFDGWMCLWQISSGIIKSILSVILPYIVTENRNYTFPGMCYVTGEVI